MSHIKVDHTKCVRDGICVAECPARIFSAADDGSIEVAKWAEKGCIHCGHCVAVCPVGAITVDGVTPEQCQPLDKAGLPSWQSAAHLMQSRRSIRAYKEEPLPRETLEELLDVARYAPTGHNTQPVHWLVIQSRQEVRRLSSIVIDWMKSEIAKESPIAAAYNMEAAVIAWENDLDPICRHAPHVVVAHAPRNEGVSRPACTIALAHLELAAYARGLGACWAGYFNAAATSFPPMFEALGLPDGHMNYGALLVGAPKYGYKRIPPRAGVRAIWR